MKIALKLRLIATVAVLLIGQTARAATEGPYGGTPGTVPGLVQAENYDTGGEGVAYHDTDAANNGGQYRTDGVDIEATTDTGGGYDVGWTAAGEWLNYTVNVPSAGAYKVAFRVSSLTTGGTLHIQNAAGTNLTGTVTIPATGGWQTWKTVNGTVILPAGRQVLTLFEDTGGYNVNSMTFVSIPLAPTGLTAKAGSAQVSLAWKASATAATYNVYRGLEAGAESSTPVATGITGTSYTDTGVASGTTYFYRVAAVNTGGISRKSNEVSVTLPGAAAPDFGSNVLIFDPSMSAASIQSQVDAVFSQQETNQFGSNRYALIFKPGTYNVSVRVGFYTQVLGLGQSPDDVTINGAVQADADWFQGNATQNFWRSAENLSVLPSGGTAMWAVSQASPLRRMHVKGGLVLSDNGWSSGGFIADSQIDNQVNSGSQQQWLTRNSQWGSWTGANWNMVFVGVSNAPSGTFPNPPYTVVKQTPVVREKPFLTIDSAGNYSVFVPALSTNSQGTTWASGASAGQSIPISQFYIAHENTDTAATINAALSQGKNLLFTPGVYHLTDTIRVTRADTVVLGLGLATLQPQNGVTAMTVADVDGVSIGGLLFDAGATNSPILLQVGPAGSLASHAANPTALHDLFFRVGGAAVGKATVSLQINSSDVIGDDFWVWRADHSNGVGWTVNTAANGLVVNGANVTIYGLAVEHYQQYQTLWNGNGGRVYFYQSEAPYDVPNESSWMDGSVNGYASYKVANSVTSHQAWGLGVYCYFSTNSSVNLASAIEAPNTSGVKFVDMVTVSLGGVGQITHIINSTGNAANSSSTVATLTKYP